MVVTVLVRLHRRRRALVGAGASSLPRVAVDGGERPPGFVYGIIVSDLRVLQLLRRSTSGCSTDQVGQWADYLFGERIYIVMSFVAKSALAWQIFANTLID